MAIALTAVAAPLEAVLYDVPVVFALLLTVVQGAAEVPALVTETQRAGAAIRLGLHVDDDADVSTATGIAATRRILQPERPTPHVPRAPMLTTFDVDEYVYDALCAGASGFFLKDALPEDLTHAVRVIAAGDALLAPSITRRFIERFATQPSDAPRPAALRLNALSDREREALELIGRGLSNAEIAASLYIGEQTVKTHVGKLLQKLHARDRVQLVITAYDAGLVQPG